MKHVVQTDELAWKAFTAGSLKGYELKPSVIGSEYTDAYSVDMVRVAPGGFSAAHVDAGRHAFFILEGRGRITIGDESFEVGPGAIVKVPPGIAHAVNNTGEASLVFLTVYDPPRNRT
jgi:mannose-6-phosphate isomerase-like protein (cupin superfamily)